jgi:hypothetical protein
MKFRVEVVCINEAGQEDRSAVLELERCQLAMETLGLNLCESKAMTKMPHAAFSSECRVRENAE